MKYTLFESEHGSNATLLHNGELLVAASTHPNWDAIVAGLRAGDEGVADLFDLGRTITKNFEKVTDRVSVKDGKLYLDNDEMHDALSKKVLEFMDSGEQDYLPLLRFFEKIQANPNEHSRTQAYDWLSRHGFALTDDGNIVAYKNVKKTNVDGVFESMHSGHAIVNGVEVNGQVKQSVGDVVEMPRSEVNHNPSQGCHTGLHVGNLRFASTFSYGGNTQLILVEVNPRDIVSVPTDSNWEKVRVCRYKVVSLSDGTELGARWNSPAVAEDDEVDDYYNEDCCEYCYDKYCDCSCEPVIVRARVSRPTDNNYKSLQRDAKGHFLPKNPGTHRA